MRPKTDREKYERALAKQRKPAIDAALRREEEALLADLAAGRVRPNPRRITMALDVMTLYGPEVDRACGVEEPAVDEWETGQRVPTPEQLQALAELTNMRLDFFMRDDIEDSGPGFICGSDGCHALSGDD